MLFILLHLALTIILDFTTITLDLHDILTINTTMMMQSTFTSSLVLLIAAMASSTAVAEFTGLRNFEQSLSNGFGPCTTNEDCSDEFTQCANSSQGCYCKKEHSIELGCDSLGECVINNLSMTKIFRPVCGCNGVDFNSASEAASKGVNVECYGSCPCPADAPSSAPSSESYSDVAAVE